MKQITITILASICGFAAGIALAFTLLKSRPIGHAHAGTTAKNDSQATLRKNEQTPHADLEALRRDFVTREAQNSFSVDDSVNIFLGKKHRESLRVLKNLKLAKVQIGYFDRNGELSKEFCTLFDLNDGETARVNDLLRSTLKNINNAIYEHSKVTPTGSGGMQIEFNAVPEGAEIYDSFMDSLKNAIGSERYDDIILHNNEQIQSLFHQFGGEIRTVTIDKTESGEYLMADEINQGPRKFGRRNKFKTMGDISKRNPELQRFLPADSSTPRIVIQPQMGAE